MRYTLSLLVFLSMLNLDSLMAQVPLSQVEGFLEVYLPQDTSSMYVGWKSGQKLTSNSERYNVFMGSNAGRENISGRDNVFIGHISGAENTTGSFNVFIGESAGLNNKGGGDNVFIGDGAGLSNINGGDNVYIGYSAGISNATGQDNTFIGEQAGTDERGMERRVIRQKTTRS